MMKTTKHKLSEFDKLKLEKARLREQIAQQTKIIDGHWTYIQNNAGSLLVNSAVSVVESKLSSGVKSFLSPILGLILAKPQEKEMLAKHQGKSSSFIRSVISVTPVVIDIVKPLVIGFIIKQIKKRLFKK